MVKPDGVHRGLVGKIISRFEEAGLKLKALKLLQIDEELAERHYGEHKEKPFFPSLKAFITSGPVVAMAIEGPRAVDICRKIIGSTDPFTSPAGTIRGDYGLLVDHNLIHGSDSLESAAREIPLFFSKDEIHQYKNAADTWI